MYDLLDVKIEFMFDNGKGHIMQRTDIFQFVKVCGEIWWELKVEQVYQHHEGEGVGMERRVRVNYGMKKNYKRDRFFEWIGWQYLRDLDSYCTGCRLKMGKLYREHVFELIRCYPLID